MQMQLELISEFNKAIGYVVNMKKLIVLLYASKSNWKVKLKYQSYCASTLLGTL